MEEESQQIFWVINVLALLLCPIVGLYFGKNLRHGGVLRHGVFRSMQFIMLAGLMLTMVVRIPQHSVNLVQGFLQNWQRRPEKRCSMLGVMEVAAMLVVQAGVPVMWVHLLRFLTAKPARYWFDIWVIGLSLFCALIWSLVSMTDQEEDSSLGSYCGTIHGTIYVLLPWTYFMVCGVRYQVRANHVKAFGKYDLDENVVEQIWQIANRLTVVHVFCWAPTFLLLWSSFFVEIPLSLYLAAYTLSSFQMGINMAIVLGSRLFRQAVKNLSIYYANKVFPVHRTHSFWFGFAKERSSNAVANEQDEELEDSFEIVFLTDTEKSQARLQVSRRFVMVLIELVDGIVDVANCAAYIVAVGSVTDLYGSLYLFSTIVICLVSFFMARSHALMAQTISKEVKNGIKVKKGRGRQVHNHNKRALDDGDESEDASSDRMASNTNLLELEILHLRRSMRMCLLTMVHGFLEDFVTLLFILWRVAATTTMFDTAFALCLLEKASPWPCFDGQFSLSLVQFTVSLSAFVYKLSFYRDYRSNLVLFEAKFNELTHQDKNGASILDQFKRGEISEHEINTVVRLREFLADELSHVCNGIGSDLQLLQLLRRCNGDEIETAKCVREWFDWRTYMETDEVRRDILLRDISWDMIPGMDVFRQYVPYVCDFDVDFATNALIQYVYAGQNAQYDLAFSALTQQDQFKLLLYILERSLIAVEHLSMEHGKIFHLKIICEAFGTPGGAENIDFTNLLDKFSEIIGRYPFEVEFVLWKPNGFFLNLLDELGRRSKTNQRVSVVRTFKQLSQLLAPSVIPSQLHGKRNFQLQWEEKRHPAEHPKCAVHENEGGDDDDDDDDSISGLPDPWGLRAYHAKNVISFLVGKVNELAFFHAISRTEVLKVEHFRRHLMNCESKALATLKKSTMEIENVKRSLRDQLVVFQLDTTLGHQAVLIWIELKLLDLCKDGFRLESLPVEVLGPVNLYRLLQKNAQDILLATKELIKISLWRRNSMDLNGLNSQVRDGNMSLDEISVVRDHQSTWPIDPIIGFDPDKGLILSLMFLQSKTDQKSIGIMTALQIETRLASVFEYLSILANHLSLKHEKIIKVGTIWFADEYPSCSSWTKPSPFLKVVQTSRLIQRTYFPNLVDPENEIFLTTRSQHFVDFFNFLGQKFGIHHNSFGDGKTISVDENGQKQLEKQISLSNLPASFFRGSTFVEIPDRFPKLNDFLRAKGKGKTDTSPLVSRFKKSHKNPNGRIATWKREKTARQALVSKIRHVIRFKLAMQVHAEQVNNNQDDGRSASQTHRGKKDSRKQAWFRIPDTSFRSTGSNPFARIFNR